MRCTSSQERPVLAVDAGGTQTRALIAERGGRRSEGCAGPANWTTLGPVECTHTLTEAIRQALRFHGISADQLTGACCALAGYYPPWHEAEVRTALQAILPGVPLRLEPDLIAAWAGATEGEPGGVLIAGTGAVVYARDSAGRSARAGGWGPVCGDEGGGYWIGCEALRAVARALDGRGPETALCQVVADRCEGGGEGRPSKGALTSKRTVTAVEVEGALRSVYRERWSRARIASLAEDVSQLASAGDEVAAGVLQRAADELGALIAAAARRLDWMSDPFPVAMVGGLFEAGPVLREPLERWVEKSCPHVVWQQPKGPPIEGALLLARAEADRWARE